VTVVAKHSSYYTTDKIYMQKKGRNKEDPERQHYAKTLQVSQIATKKKNVATDLYEHTRFINLIKTKEKEN